MAARIARLEADNRQLLARLKAERLDAGVYVRSGPLTLDLLADRAWIAGQPLRLGQGEWVVLTMLARYGGETVTAAALVGAIRDRHRRAAGRRPTRPSPWPAVRAAVSRLRSALGEHGGLVETVAGRGYRLRLLTIPTIAPSADGTTATEASP